MRLMLVANLLFFSFLAQAKESKDLTKLLRESKCVSTRTRTGKVYYKCDGTLGAELAAQKNHQQEKIGKPSAQTRQTLQPEIKRQSASIPETSSPQLETEASAHDTTDEKIKSCLASIYQNQVQHYQTRGKYTTVSEDMGIDRNETCNGLYIYTNVANDREFKITAKLGNNVWTIDQSRNIMKKR